MFLYLQEIKEILNEQHIATSPCSVDDIYMIEKYYKIKLPIAYCEFLLLMGKGADRFMLGSSCFFDSIFNLKTWAEDVLNENNFKNFPLESFVFWMHQGYQFAFFPLNKGENPEVYYYSETSRQKDFILHSNSLKDFLMLEIKAFQYYNQRS